MDLSSFCLLAQRVCVLSHFSRVRFSETLWTTACQASLSMGFSRQEYCSGLPCLPPSDLPNPGTEPTSLMSSALVGGFFTTSAIWEAQRRGRGYQETASGPLILCVTPTNTNRDPVRRICLQIFSIIWIFHQCFLPSPLI